EAGRLTKDAANAMMADLDKALSRPGLSRGDANLLLKGFVRGLGLSADETRKGIDRLTGAVRGYEDAAKDALKVDPFKLMAPSLESQIRALEAAAQSIAGKGKTPLDKFREEMEKLDGLQRESERLQRAQEDQRRARNQSDVERTVKGFG